MTTKSVKLQVLGDYASAMRGLDQFDVKLRDVAKGASISLKLNNADLTNADLDKMTVKIRELSDQGTNIRVALTGAGETDDELDSLTRHSRELSDAGARVSTTMDDAGKKTGLLSNIMGSGIGNVLLMGAGFFSVGTSLKDLISSGSEYQQAQAQLNNAITDAGQKTSTYKTVLGQTVDQMAKYGYTGSQVDTSLTSLIRSTGSVSEAISMESTAADLAAARHIDLASACSMLAKAAGGAMKGMKDLGITQVTGATQAKAMSTAYATLQDQIQSAGGMEAYAASQHISLAQAEKLTAEAAGSAAMAQYQLASRGLTLASVTTLVTDAQAGDSKAIATLTQDHLTLAQAQQIVTGSAGGSIDAYNQLGIVVLPKTATAAQRLAEIQKVLNERLGGAAAAQADTYAGHIAAMKANFENIAENIGAKLLPALSMAVDWIAKLTGNKTALTAFALSIAGIGIAFVISSFEADAFFTAVKAGLVSTGIGIAIIAISIALALLLTHWKEVSAWISGAWMTVWHTLDGAFQATFHWLQSNWPLVLAILVGPIGLAALEIYKHWSDITAWTAGLWHNVVNIFTDLGHDVEHIWDNIWSWLSNGFTNFVQSEEQGWVNFWDNIKNTANVAGGWVYNHLHGWWDDLINDARSAWNTMVSDITGVWDRVENAVAAPVRWVANNVWNKFANVVDTVTRFLSLGSPIPTLSLSSGGHLPGYGGGDVLPALLEPGETVVSKESSRYLAPVFAAAGVPGYSIGGIIGGIGSDILGAAKEIAGFAKNLVMGGVEAASKPILNSILSLMGSMPGGNSGFGQMIEAVPKMLVKKVLGWMSGQDSSVGSGSDIVSFAESFIGKVPYVWGGTSPSGWDCSGFTSYVYHHFGYPAPRTSETQWDWVKKVSSPVPGGLAFFAGSDGTAASPGHVGIVVNANKMVDAYSTGFGTRFNNIVGSSGAISGFGIPPFGFGPSGSNAATGGSMSASQIANLWIAMGGPASAASNMAAIANAESGDNPGAVQQGQPAATTGWGLYQITPTSGINQNGAFGNLLNANNNTKAALSLFDASGYGPWASDPIGRQLSASPFGYSGGGMINELIAGIGQSGQRYLFGETGPEFVQPMSGGYVNGSNGTTITILVQAGDCVDPDAVAKAIHEKLRRLKTKKGGQPLGLD